MILNESRAWLSLNATSFVAQFVFNAWLERIHDEQRESGISVQTAIPVELTSVVRAWLVDERHWTQFDAHFAYASWLRAGGEVALVRNPIAQWLASRDTPTSSAFATDFDAGRRVLTSWLQSSREPDIVKVHVDAWLKWSDNGLREEARFVFVSWLAAGGAPSSVREPLLAWLAKVQFTIKTEQLLGAWLEHGGAVSDVEPYVLRWIAEIPVANLTETDYLIGRWRTAGGAREVVDTALVKRAHHFSVSPDVYWSTAPHVPKGDTYDSLATLLKSDDAPLEAYLNAVREALDERHDGSVRAVAQVVRFWIERHRIGGVKVLQTRILNWLECYRLHEHAHYVIPELLELGDIGDHEFSDSVEEITIERLQQNVGKCKKSDFYVFRGWIRSHRPVESIANLLERWLLDNPPLSAKEAEELSPFSEPK